MSLENYTGYIPALVDTNPTPTDPKSEGDDHLRGIKKTLSDTFVGFTEIDQGVEVTASEINEVCAGGINARLPAGMVACFAFTAQPLGWLNCNGSLKQITEYPDLFAAIGNVWGGDGVTDFRIPDMRGQFARGWNNQTTGDDANRVFASNQDSDNLSHTHAIQNDTHNHTAVTAGLHQHEFFDYAPSTSNDYEGGSGKNGVALTGNNTNEKGSHTHTINNDTHNHVATASGGFESRPVNVALAYFIKT